LASESQQSRVTLVMVLAMVPEQRLMMLCQVASFHSGKQLHLMDTADEKCTADRAERTDATRFCDCVLMLRMNEKMKVDFAEVQNLTLPLPREGEGGGHTLGT